MHRLKKLYEAYLNYRIKAINYQIGRLAFLGCVRSIVGAQRYSDTVFDKERMLKKADEDIKDLSKRRNSLTTKLQFLENQ